jgi:hypothetical protein
MLLASCVLGNQWGGNGGIKSGQTLKVKREPTAAFVALINAGLKNKTFLRNPF